MLKKFEVKGFKNFKDKLSLDFGKTRNYDFSKDAVCRCYGGSVVKTSLIYGANASGKSNLGLAIFDIIIHLTDKERDLDNYSNYLNLDKGESAEFSYEFVFEEGVLEYNYSKSNAETLLHEEIKIDGNLVLSYDYSTSNGELYLKGTENLRFVLNDSKLSSVKFVYKNTVLDMQTKENRLFEQFMDFVDKMLLFSSLERNHYQGFKLGRARIPDNIVASGKLKEFEEFLGDNGIVYRLEDKRSEKNENEFEIMCLFEKRSADFFAIASKGTCTLALFFNWFISMSEVSFVFIDEFDAFYHSDVARTVVKAVLGLPKVQGIMTTHNTDIMTNELLRPDCYFIIDNSKITSLADATSRELRVAHNLRKLYNAGTFKP